MICASTRIIITIISIKTITRGFAVIITIVLITFFSSSVNIIVARIIPASVSD